MKDKTNHVVSHDPNDVRLRCQVCTSSIKADDQHHQLRHDQNCEVRATEVFFWTSCPPRFSPPPNGELRRAAARGAPMEVGLGRSAQQGCTSAALPPIGPRARL
jgi:hypothetical protein